MGIKFSYRNPFFSQIIVILVNYSSKNIALDYWFSLRDV
jgi:hypothetical protein